MKKRIQRITAFLTAACMSVSFLAPQMFPNIGSFSELMGFAESEWKTPHIIVTHYHANGETTTDEYFSEFVDESHKPEYITIKAESDEKFVGYSVGAGSNIVIANPYYPEGDPYYPCIVKTDESDCYEKAHLVKINMFYQEIPKVGEDFQGTDFKAEYPDVDEYMDVVFDKDGTPVYNTAPGLHTNKTAESLGNREYQIGLESWYASGTPADVGLILDASGSMAFAADVPEPIRFEGKALQGFYGDPEETPKLEDVAYRYLPLKAVNNVLENYDYSQTDYSKLSFANSRYFVYDPRQGGGGLQGDKKDGKIEGTITDEFVPLAYWDGKAETSETYVAQDNLVNYWGSVEDAKKLFDEESQLNKSGSEGLGGGEGIALSNSAGTTAAGTGSVTLSDSEEYSISLFIKVKDVAKLSDNDILTFVDDDGDKNIIRLKKNNSIEIRSSAGWFFRINNVLVNNKGFVLTYVISDSGSKVYINGADPSKKDVKIGSNKVTVDTGQFDGKIRKLNGSTKVTIDGKGFTKDANAYLDEMFIYSKALTEEEINKIYNFNDETPYTPESVTLSTNYYATNSVGEPFAKVDEKYADQAGWYYVTSSSHWDDLTTYDTGKELRSIQTNNIVENYIDPELANKFDEKEIKAEDIEKGNQEKYIYFGNGMYTGNSKSSDWNDNIVNLHTVPDGITNDNLALEDLPTDSTGNCPTIFFFDDAGYLRCFYGTGKAGECFCSYVFKKADEEKVKTEVLQEVLGQFISKFSAEVPQSKISAVRFSTKEADSEERRKNLMLLDWTSLKESEELQNAVDMLKLDKDGTEGYFSANDNNEYGYGLTGGTFTMFGLQAYQELLQNSDKIEGDENSKHLIIFTDGKDTSEDDAGLKAIADQLKEDGYTIYCVMLSGGGKTPAEVQEDADILKNNVASVDESGEPLVFIQSADEITEAFTEKILGQIKQNLDGYTVQDYIDPRFDLVAKTAKGGSETTIYLNNDGAISYGVETKNLITTDGLTVYLGDSEVEATLCYDPAKSMYYIQWTEQTIPGNVASGDTVTVWNTTFKLKAKEDFLGGNDILTNGNGAGENYVFHPEDPDEANSGVSDAGLAVEDTSGKITNYPSKGFPRTVVNVPLLDIKIEPRSDHIYLGEKVTPGEMLKSLLGTVEVGSEDHGIEFSAWDYLADYDAFKKNSSLASSIDTLLDKGKLTIPYSYLTSGSDAHKNDVIGNLTYTWEVTSEGIEENYPGKDLLKDDFVSIDVGDKTYQLSVKYEPYADYLSKNIDIFEDFIRSYFVPKVTATLSRPIIHQPELQLYITEFGIKKRCRSSSLH